MPLRYNPLNMPDPKRWLAMDESDQLEMVLTYHRKERIEFPNENIHASIHVAVENQVALGDETPVAATLERLMAEGLDRHDAIHAIGSVLAGQIWEMMQPDIDEPSDPNEVYFKELRDLTAQKWFDRFSEPEG